MKVVDTISSIYKPVQPVIKESVEGIEYLERPPDSRLQSAIYCYWQLKTHVSLKEVFFYRVVADGCIDIFFQPGNIKESFVMGFCNRYTSFPLSHSFHYVGIRFLPTMFSQLFRIDASSLTNRFEELSNVVPYTAAFIASSFDPKDDFTTIRAKLDAYFLDLFFKSCFKGDTRLYEALQMIITQRGVLNIFLK